MTKSLTSLEHLDAAVLADIAALHDEAGVLTVLAARGRAGAVEVRSAVHRHRHAFPGLEELLGAAVAITDDALDGPAHGLVAGLSTGARHSFALPAPVTTLVTIADGAAVTPIARAVDAASPVGVVDVGHDGVRVLESATDGPRELPRIPFEVGGDWAEYRGPAHAQPGRGTESSSQRDLFARRLADQTTREVAAAVPTIASTAASRGWRTTLVAGDPHLTERVIAGLEMAFPLKHRLSHSASAGAQINELGDELIAARRAVLVAALEEMVEHPHRFATGSTAVTEAITRGSTNEVFVDESALGSTTEDVVRAALARRVPVRFADGHLASHGAVCRLHGSHSKGR